MVRTNVPDILVTGASDAPTTGFLESVPGVSAPPEERVEEPGIPDDPSYRYEDLGLIGQGGMGQVRRVRDRDLNTVVAMKIGHTSLMQDRRLLARFIAEAQATAQLSHPGIVPVHELGVLPDGRFYFTMKEITGRTLRDAIEEAHGPAGSHALAIDGTWRLHRLIDAFHAVCEAVGYAHARGVVHRDLKPENVMLGEWGEVLVLDWGLAKVSGVADGEMPTVEPVVTNRTIEADLRTRTGIVAGTPFYMPPEQARGEFLALGPASDVYALGAILFEILHGTPPWAELDRARLVDHIAAGHPLDVIRRSTVAHLPPPEDLLAICEKATRPGAADRFAHAGLLADPVRAWLEGARNRDRALDMVSRGRGLQRTVSVLRRHVAALLAEAAEILAGLPLEAGPDVKAAAWELEDQAAGLEQDAALKENEALMLLSGAVLDVPNLDAAHQALADHYRDRHARAEALRDEAKAARLEALLRKHDRGQHVAYLEGYGRVSVTTNVARARIAIYRYAERHRRLVPTALGRDLTAPVNQLSLPRGSYLFVIRAEGRAEVRYPVFVGRLEHWDGLAPGEASPRPVHLPEAWRLSERDCYVPAGWTSVDGSDGLRRKAWVEGFVMRRTPVTCSDYLNFVNDLVDAGEIARAQDLVPLRPPRLGDAGPLFVHLPTGRYALPDPVLADRPVTMIDAAAADLYAAWYADRAGEPWRLPAEIEWEKAARGVDGRLYPWGDFFDPSFCCMRDSFDPAAVTSPYDTFVADESPYGVRGMAGVVMELCRDPWHADPLAVNRDPSAHRVARGGSWRAPAIDSRATSRTRVVADQARPDLGFRLVRPIGV